MDEPTTDKPRCKLIDESGSVFAIIAAVRRALHEAGQTRRMDEFTARATSATSYDAVLQMVFEYVDAY